MSADGAAIPWDEPLEVTFHGRAATRIAGPDVWVDMLATAGPRIVRVGLTGSTRNLLAETPDAGWETPYGRYELVGGHRLWFAPEDPDRVAVPDGEGLALEARPGGLRLTGRAEPATGLVRSMTIQLVHRTAALEVRHALRNVSERPLELAPWAITQLPLGGRVLLPQVKAAPGHHVRPNRSLVLWPYSSWEDPRFRPLDGLLTLDAQSGASFKFGSFAEAGWVAYLNDGLALVRRFVPEPGRAHPDLGCNVEVFVGRQYLELEVLGPLAVLEPGGTVALTETWSIERAEGIADERRLLGLAARLGGREAAVASTG